MSQPRSTATAPNPGAGPTDVDQLIAQYDEERPARSLTGWLAVAVTLVCFLVSAFVLRQVLAPLSQGNQYYLTLFLAFVLPLVFICYRPRLGNRSTAVAGRTDRPGPVDWALSGLALIVCLSPVLPNPFAPSGGGFDAFLDRQGQLTTLDVVMGGVLLLLVLEATRRTTGWVLPVVCVAFLVYAYYGGYIPASIPGSHAGIDFPQIVNALYNDASGFYGVPLDVCATYIVLFTIYGAVLSSTGAGRFFVDISFAMFRRSRTAPGRTVAVSGFLLGTVSGSGTATAVSLGAVTWPVLERAGYPKDKAGGMLAASGIGAILSPPTLGAAAFIIAEYLQTSYLTVLLWAMVPTLLYYLGILLAVEIDARKIDTRPVDLAVGNPWRLLLRYGYHFLSLGVIVAFLALDIPPFRAVLYAICVAAAFGLLETIAGARPTTDARTGDDARAGEDGRAGADARAGENGRADDDAGSGALAERLRAYGLLLYQALATGIRSVLPVAAVCAAAGIIVSTITKTGLGQRLADLLISAASALATDPAVVAVWTVVFAAVAISVLGLAVPVTASFIISWVVIGPALLDVGVAAPATAMFIFYYAVLSEVTPPTALAAVASAAITGGRVMPTMMQALKYSLPAFLVPLAFVLTDSGQHLLGQGSLGQVLWVTVVAAVAVAAMAAVTGGWIIGPARWPERILCLPGALLLLYLQPVSIAVGAGFLAAAVVVHLVLRRRAVPHPSSPLLEGNDPS